tara:strand:+ start:254 stop:589 length:336 start_codon:yes stop_codon:yes gene_type:complete
MFTTLLEIASATSRDVLPKLVGLKASSVSCVARTRPLAILYESHSDSEGSKNIVVNNETANNAWITTTRQRLFFGLWAGLFLFVGNWYPGLGLNGLSMTCFQRWMRIDPNE